MSDENAWMHKAVDVFNAWRNYPGSEWTRHELEIWRSEQHKKFLVKIKAYAVRKGKTYSFTRHFSQEEIENANLSIHAWSVLIQEWFDDLLIDAVGIDE